MTRTRTYMNMNQKKAPPHQSLRNLMSTVCGPLARSHAEAHTNGHSRTLDWLDEGPARQIERIQTNIKLRK